jgi:hypothetical protein
MVVARAARRLGVQDGLILAGVQVPPLPLRMKMDKKQSKEGLSD